MNSFIKPMSVFTFGCSLAIVLSSTFCSTHSYASTQLNKQTINDNVSANVVLKQNFIYVETINAIYNRPVFIVKQPKIIESQGLFTLKSNTQQELMPFEVQQNKGNELFELAIQFNDKLQLFMMYVKQLFSFNDANASDYSVNSPMNNAKAISEKCPNTN